MSSLADFQPKNGETSVPLASRLAAACLTAGVYALIALMTSQHSVRTPPRRPQPSGLVGAMPLVMAPEKSVQQSSRLAWFLAEPPRPSSSAWSSASGPVIGFAFGRDTGSGTRIAGGCYDASWAKAVSERVRSQYPPKTRDISGIAFVRFTARRDGRLNRLEIVKSSGDRLLDDAAYEMVHKAQPLPRIPGWMKVETVDAVLPIAFGDAAGKFKPSEGNCAPDPLLDRET